MYTLLRLTIICLIVVSWSGSATAQIGKGMARNEGIVPLRELPKKMVSENLVMLKVPHIRQKPGNCVPTSCAMILRYIGESASPGSLKKLAENHKPADQRNTEFTYWKDLQFALKKKGKDWKIETFAKTDEGFERGFEQIKNSLRNSLPVMIDVHLDAGHTFVIMGFDEQGERVFVRDPLIAANQARILSYQQLKEFWHNHKYGTNRSAFFPKKAEPKTEKTLSRIVPSHGY